MAYTNAGIMFEPRVVGFSPAYILFSAAYMDKNLTKNQQMPHERKTLNNYIY